MTQEEFKKVMKKFIVSAVWLIVSVPFYVLILLCTAWNALVFKNLGRLFDDAEPYEWIDKVDGYIYNKVKENIL